jgi:hypothetical protein
VSLRGDADKSLARLTSPCRRTESWKTAGFLLNQLLSNWVSHVSGLGPSFMKILTCGRSSRGSCSCTTMPRLTGHLQPGRNWPTWSLTPLDHPPDSPDLAPSDYHLFPGLKKQLKGRHFSPDAEVIAAAETWLDGQPSDFFLVACKG